jgi:phosphoribosylformylglycinamidine cyclo-ligase
MTDKSTLTYKDAGVDIDAGEALVKRIGSAVARTRRPEVIGGLGGFGGVFRVPSGYEAPLLVSGTDGVGTKLKLAIDHDRHDDVGIDLVAMCVNDIVVLGAEPLFFLDYFVTPKLDIAIAERVIKSIARGCELAGAALIGGETAEHPGMHASGEYDLAGFAVGIVEAEKVIDGRTVHPGDAVIGLASSGPHSNGFSLIRKVLESDPGAMAVEVDGAPLIDRLLEPTRIYVPSLLKLFDEARPKGIAHITGGGLIENIPRVLPAGLGVRLARSAWPRSALFEWLARAGIGDSEMYRTFNCGLGMILITAPEAVAETIASLSASGESAWRVGEVVSSNTARVEIV